MHERVEALFSRVTAELSPDALSCFEDVFTQHVVAEEKIAGGVTSEHIASHVNLTGMLRAEVSRFEDLRVGAAFVASFGAAMQRHDEVFEREAVVLEAKPTPATQCISMDLKAEDAGHHRCSVPKWCMRHVQ